MKRPVGHPFPGLHYHDTDGDQAAAGATRLALRRHTDRCYFAVDEVVHHGDGTLAGFVVEGNLIAPEDVADLKETGPDGGELCEPRFA